MFAVQPQAQVAGVGAGAVAQAGRVAGFAGVEPVVQDGAAEFGVVGPGAAVDVVGAHRGPDVVDDAGFGVDVDGGAAVVLQAVGGEPFSAGPVEQVQGLDAAQEAHRPRQLPVLVREGWQDGDHV